MVPANGVLKNFATFSTGLILTIPGMSLNDVIDENFKSVINLYGNKDSLVKIFNLVKIEENGREEEVLGGIYFRLTNITKHLERYRGEMEFKFIIAEKFKNKEENFICSVNRGDIINIKSEYEESEVDILSDTHVSLHFSNYSKLKEKVEEDSFFKRKKYSLHTTTLTFLFKEMSFPNVLTNLDLLDD